MLHMALEESRDKRVRESAVSNLGALLAIRPPSRPRNELSASVVAVLPEVSRRTAVLHLHPLFPRV